MACRAPVRVPLAQTGRKPGSGHAFGSTDASDGETRNRTEDTTIFSRLARTRMSSPFAGDSQTAARQRYV